MTVDMTDAIPFDNINSPTEGWQDLVTWDDEFCFNNEPAIIGAQSESFVANYHIPESFTSEQPYLISTPPSIIDGPPSLGNTSAPPSILDGSFSFGQGYSTSPPLDTTATSPFLSQDEGHYFGSFNDTFSSFGHITESPVLDTRFERIQDSLGISTQSFEPTPEAVFNPHVAGSSQSFSGLDIKVSQVFSNLGTWVDQPLIIEPITEDDERQAEADSIFIPRPVSRSYDFADRSYLHTDAFQPQPTRSRAITIPEVNRGPLHHSYNAPSTRWAQRAHSALSVSPVSHRRPSSATLSRSMSQTRHRMSTSSLSPTTDSYGWVSYRPNPATNKLAPTSTEGFQGRTPRGRKKALTPEQRTHAALMRIVGACSNCKLRKEKCDPGTPCKSCLEHYKGDLVNHPCRDRILSDLSGTLLSDRFGWHPTARSLDAFVEGYHVSTGVTYCIPLDFGFGPSMTVPVHAVHIHDSQTLTHNHIIYSWPPQSASVSPQTHAVLPAVLTQDTTSNLTQALDAHLSLLVTHHFRSFPLYCSPLRILREVYVFFRSLKTNTPQARTLHQALKLLVLVHIGGDITLPSQHNSPILSQLINSTMGLANETNPTPCFIRSQFGAVMPGLALSLMKDVLSSLEQLLLNRDCDEWPVVLAILITVLMTVESIHYHAAKLPYHHKYDDDAAPRPTSLEEDRRIDDEGVKALLAFYSACFSGCHARLRPDWEGEAMPLSSSSQPSSSGKTWSAEDMFVEGVRGAIRNASGAGYLVGKVGEKRQGDDMGFFFDRLVARLLLLKY